MMMMIMKTRKEWAARFHSQLEAPQASTDDRKEAQEEALSPHDASDPGHSALHTNKIVSRWSHLTITFLATMSVGMLLSAINSAPAACMSTQRPSKSVAG